MNPYLGNKTFVSRSHCMNLLLCGASVVSLMICSIFVEQHMIAPRTSIANGIGGLTLFQLVSFPPTQLKPMMTLSWNIVARSSVSVGISRNVSVPSGWSIWRLISVFCDTWSFSVSPLPIDHGVIVFKCPPAFMFFSAEVQRQFPFRWAPSLTSLPQIATEPEKSVSITETRKIHLQLSEFLTWAKRFQSHSAPLWSSANRIRYSIHSIGYGVRFSLNSISTSIVNV
jgi:type IV secretory pathway protease TraF